MASRAIWSSTPGGGIVKRPALSEATEYAAKTANAVRTALTAKAAAETANETDSNKLDALAAEIEAMDLSLDFDDMAAIQMLANKREQLSRMHTKFATDAKKRIIEADELLRHSIYRDEFSAWLNEQRISLLDSVCFALRPFFTERGRAMNVACNSDAAAVLGRFSYMSAQASRLDYPAIVEALDAFIAGKPLWNCARND